MTLSSIRDYCTVAVLALALAGCAPAPSGKVTVAAAADLRFALEEVARDYRAQYSGSAIDIVYGSSGNFYTQIRNGAPFDVFLSADVDYPNRLVSDGLAKHDNVFIYGVGRLVLWVPENSPIDPREQGLKALEDPAIRHIAIANPQHAPYGKAAESALRGIGIYDRVAPKLVLGENIAQTFQFAQSGAADAAIVALSLVLAPNQPVHGRWAEIPQQGPARMFQAGVLLKESPAADSFRRYLMSAAGRATLKRYGFSMPDVLLWTTKPSR